MIHNLFIPCRIGNYYLHTKKVLTIEVTPIVVYGLLFEYSAKKIILKEKYTISLKENSYLAQINAIKKIVSSAGKVDEIISNCATPAMVFKELQLPFIGKDNLKIVLPLEIENILPFSLDQAVINFMVTNEDLEKKVSTVLVCAVRKQDIDEQYELFKKADVSLDVLTVDVFALYHLYQSYIGQNTIEKKSVISKVSLQGNLVPFYKRLFTIFSHKKTKDAVNQSQQILQNFNPERTEVLVDIGYNSIKVLYIKDNILSAVRVIPFGIGQTIETLQDQAEKSYEDMIHSLSSGHIDSVLLDKIKKIFDEIAKTLLYFQQKEGLAYLAPHKISMTGFYTNFAVFIEQAKSYFGSIVIPIDMKKCLESVSVSYDSKINITSEYFRSISCALSWHYQVDNNLLETIAREKELRAVSLQTVVMVLTSLLCLGAVWWRSSEQLQRWQTAYNVSRKQLLTEIQDQMNLDVRGEKNLKALVEKTESVLKRERQLWFSFTQQNEASILEYLQDLSVAIDREAIGLELKSLHIDYQKVIMSGTVKDFPALDIFYEELQELKLLKLVDRPIDFANWTIELKPKTTAKGA
jgi:Tfp pilus assembly PilM family ATPase